MKVFLTGERQIGKSTIIQKVLKLIGPVELGGYFTRVSGSEICMYPASDPDAQGFAVGKKGKIGYPEVFDGKGSELLEKSVSKELVILDEIGWMESDADNFSQTVIDLVSSDVDVLGVIRLGCSSKLCNALREMQGVEILTVTEENREILPEMIAEKFRGTN